MTRIVEDLHAGGNTGKPLPDLELARRVRAGSVEAWHEFVARYLRLVSAVLRQQLPFESEDDRRGLLVDLLQELYSGGLDLYEGRASLATWLVVVVRSRAVDRLRHRHGRRRSPAGLERLEDLERRVFQLYYVEHLSIEAVIEVIASAGRRCDMRLVSGALDRIEACVDRRFLEHARYDRAASREGVDSGRELRYLVEARIEYESYAAEQSPEHRAIEAERAAAIDRLQSLRAQLPEAERRALELRYEHRMTAKDIARSMRLESPRRAYGLIDRALRQLRTQLRDALEWWNP